MKHPTVFLAALLAQPCAASDWCSPEQGTAPRQPVAPEWVCEKSAVAALQERLALFAEITPLFLTPDLDADGIEDFAAWVVERQSGRRGLAVVMRGTDESAVLGLGNRDAGADAGADLSMFDEWAEVPAGRVLSSHWQDGTLELQGDAIRLAKSESAAVVVYWDGLALREYVLAD